jgi:hypothetical protein
MCKRAYLRIWKFITTDRLRCISASSFWRIHPQAFFPEAHLHKNQRFLFTAENSPAHLGFFSDLKTSEFGPFSGAKFNITVVIKPATLSNNKGLGGKPDLWGHHINRVI